MLENFIYAKEKSLFETALNNGNVLDEAIVFIEDTKEIWNHGTYFDGSTFDPSNIEASIAKLEEEVDEINFILVDAGGSAEDPDVPVYPSDLENYVTEEELEAKGYITAAQVPNPDLSSYITKEDAHNYTDTAIANLVDSAPETLNTLNELATAISEHQDVTDALYAAISNKADKSELPTKVSLLENDVNFGIPIVEELDSNSPIGTIVSFKQSVKIDKYEMINTPISIRNLNNYILDSEGVYLSSLNVKDDVIIKINFLIPDPENIPSKFKLGDHYEFLVHNGFEWFVIGVQWEDHDDCFVVYWYNSRNDGVLLYNNLVELESMKIFENYFNSFEKIYYYGIILDKELPVTIEETFDLIDYFITINTPKEFKTTEEIIKAIPYIKQEYGWGSLEGTDKDFNNDFNFDFN